MMTKEQALERERQKISHARRQSEQAGFRFRPGLGNPDVHVAEREDWKCYGSTERELLMTMMQRKAYDDKGER